jgi:protein-disulfide isomerase
MAERCLDRRERTVLLPMSRYDIADYLSLSVETVSRALTRLGQGDPLCRQALHLDARWRSPGERPGRRGRGKNLARARLTLTAVKAIRRINPIDCPASMRSMQPSTAFSMRSKERQIGVRSMSTLRTPVTPHDHIRGPADAPVTLVEYGDYQCPHCGAAYPIVETIREQFSDTLRFVFRHFPLTQIHPMAQPAAEAAEFAGAQGRFWEMHDGLYQNQDSLADERLGFALIFKLAEAIGLSAGRLREALERGEYAAKVRSDMLGGLRSGVNGTPTFFINGRRHDGTYMYEDLVLAIERVMPVGASRMAHAGARHHHLGAREIAEASRAGDPATARGGSRARARRRDRQAR